MRISSIHNVAIDNPFSNLVPNFTIFGAQFTSWWQKLFVGLWAAAIIIAGAYLLLSILQIRKATNNNVPGQADEAKTHAVWAGSSLGGLVGFGAIMAAVFAVFS